MLRFLVRLCGSNGDGSLEGWVLRVNQCGVLWGKEVGKLCYSTRGQGPPALALCLGDQWGTKSCGESSEE